MRSPSLTWLLFTALIALSSNTAAQPETLDLRAEVISETVTRFIYQDQNGFIWMSTGGNVARYDGATTQIYRHTPFDTTTISNGHYFAMASGNDGSIWLGAAMSGVNRMTGYGGRIEVWGAAPEYPNGLTAAGVNRLFIDSQERLWVGTYDGLNLFDKVNNRFIHFRNDPDDPASLPGNFIGDIVEDRSGSLWVGTNKGLARLDPGLRSFERFPVTYQTEKIFPDQSGLPYEHVRAVFIDDADQIWVVLSEFFRARSTFGQYPFGILARFDQEDGSFHPIPLIDSGNLIEVSSILQDRLGRYWAATENGLAAFDPAKESFVLVNLWKAANERVGPIEVRILTMDRSGALWIGTESGVARIALGRPGIESYSTVADTGLSRPTTGWVDAIAGSRDGRKVFFSTGFEEFKSPNGFSILDRVTGEKLEYRHNPNDPNSLSDNYVLAVSERHDGKVWIAGQSGLNLFDPETEAFERFYFDNPRVSSAPVSTSDFGHPSSDGVSNRIDAIWPVSDDELWISTVGMGPLLLNLREGSKTTFDNGTSDFSSARYVREIIVSKTGAVWMVVDGGVDGGVASLDPETGEFETWFYDPKDPSSLSATNGTSIHEDDQGRIWVGSFGGGLSLFQPKSNTWIRFGLENGLPANDVVCITNDEQGYIWVSTFQGISRFDPGSETFDNFWAVDGIQGRRFAGGGCQRAANGELFFSGEFGFNIIRPRLVDESTVPPSIVLTGIGISGTLLRPGLDPQLPRPLSQTELIQLESDENNVLFEYSGVDLGHSEGREFEYRLEPLESEWNQAGSRQSAAYANLDAGDYTFKVRVSVGGLTSPSPASVRFNIAPPWWGNWWAFLLFGLAVMGALYGAYSFRVQRLKAYSERLEEKVAQRTHDLEEEKRKTEQQAERLLELDETKNRFFTNISHEFRTPLTLIVGPIQDALDGAFDDDPDELHRQHGVVLTSARRLLRLINQLLDLSKVESGKLGLDAQPGDVVSFVTELTTSFSPAAERLKIDLSFRSDRDSLPCLFDGDKIEKIVTNLLSNALKFTPADGKVAVDLEARDGEWDGKEDGGEVAEITISVRDTGRGIPAEDLDRVFDRFQQVDTSTTREHEGTGIGLSLARELTELHGGTISVESRVDFGTTFRVEIAVEKISAEVLGDRPSPPAGPGDVVQMPGEKIVPDLEVEPPTRDTVDVILIVEDNADVRSYVRSHLSPLYRVIEAENGEEGLAAAKEHRPNLILSDVMMPKMDGYNMVRRIREIDELRHVPIVMLTAKAEELEAVEGLESGADDYIPKPFGSAELLARVSGLISSRREMREQFSEEIIVKGKEIVVTSDDAALLQTITEIVDGRLDDSNFGSDWLADEVGLSRRQLERKLDTVLGESPAALIRRLRLERASQLIRARSGTISEIAYSVGFTSPAYFTRAFRKAYGESPTQHRPES
ncbi:MAG: two-component regulator propeller domain-containing protein [Rhodothermia bacterium]